MIKYIKTLGELYRKHKEIINYLIFGGLTTVVNFISYYIVARIIGFEEIASSGISWFCAVLFAYITNRYLVFESKTHGVKDILKELVSFFACRILSGLLCEIGVFAFMVKVLNINDIVAKLITQVMVIILNYILSKCVIFKKLAN